jgi:ABC-type transport system involved in cytochrome c biogenesis ATPase subunit
MCGVIGDQLAAARRRAFVGRRDELALFEGLLRDGAAAVVLLHGPGGIGKTTLLHRVADLAEEHGRCVVRLDAEGCGQSADEVQAEWARRHRGGDEPVVLLVDILFNNEFI